MVCDGCGREGVFRSVWDVHIDARTMELLCTRCYIERIGEDKGSITNREMQALLSASGQASH